MDRSELYFDLPEALIAQTPAEPRDHCRLMVLDRASQAFSHRHFFDLPSLLREGDVLVFNQSKVFRARLNGKRASGGGVEVLLLRHVGEQVWACLIGKKVREGEVLDFGDGLQGEVLPKRGHDSFVRLNKAVDEVFAITEKVGEVPLPPYIKQPVSESSQYQTVYASQTGSAAAPTAGLHFTPELLEKLRAQGVQPEFVTLHVGLGTFQPVKTSKVEDHPIHSEWYSVDSATWQRLQQAKKEGRRIIAVGTTSVRVLETLARKPDQLHGETNLFIVPGFSFAIVDAMITNFHTPYSSLLALVYAFGGQEFMRQAYEEAVKERYRFFSFGDAMFIG